MLANAGTEKVDSLEDDLEKFLDALYEKRSQTREKALAAFVGAFENHMLHSFVENRSFTLLHQFSNSIKRGSLKEVSLASRAIGLLAITIGGQNNAHEIVEEMTPHLFRALKSGESSKKISVMDCLAVVTLVAGEDEDTEASMKNIWELINPKLGNNYFNNKPYEEALQNLPLRVQPSEWHDACEYWSKDETKTRSNVNYKNRTIAPSQTHVLGRRSIDSLQARYANSNNGARMDRVAVFEATHSKVGEDGIRHWIHPNYEQLHGRIMELILPNQDEGGSSCSPMDREEAFRAVMPSEHDGFVRCAGRSVTKTSWYGRQGSQNAYVEKLEEQFRQNKEELFDIKLQMKEQTAKLREELHQQSQNIQKTREEMQQEHQQMHDHMQYQSQMMDKLMSILQAPPTNCSRRTRSSRCDDYNLGDRSQGFAT